MLHWRSVACFSYSEAYFSTLRLTLGRLFDVTLVWPHLAWTWSSVISHLVLLRHSTTSPSAFQSHYSTSPAKRIYHIHYADITLSSDHRPASSLPTLQGCYHRTLSLETQGAHCCMPPQPAAEACFHYQPMIYDSREKNKKNLSCSFGHLKGCCLNLPCALYLIMNILYQLKTALCAGLSLMSAILILSNRGYSQARFERGLLLVQVGEWILCMSCYLLCFCFFLSCWKWLNT